MVYHVGGTICELRPAAAGGGHCILGEEPLTDTETPCGSFRSSADHTTMRNAQRSNQLPPEVHQALVASSSSIQEIEIPGAPVKYDEYSVRVLSMPPGLTPEAYLSKMANDLNRAVRNERFDFINTFEKVTSQGTPANVGTIYDIDILGLDNGSVILVEQTSTSFTLQTITTPQTGSHPENGARQFGFESNPDGSVTFYTRGVSQAEVIVYPILYFYKPKRMSGKIGSLLMLTKKISTVLGNENNWLALI